MIYFPRKRFHHGGMIIGVFASLVLALLSSVAVSQEPVADVPVAGPIGDTFRAVCELRNGQGALAKTVRENRGMLKQIVDGRTRMMERMTAFGDRISGFRGLFDEQGKRLSSLRERVASFESRHRSWFQDWQKEKTERRKMREETRQVVAEMKAEIADSRADIAKANKGRTAWRAATMIMFLVVGLIVWLK